MPAAVWNYITRSLLSIFLVPLPPPFRGRVGVGVQQDYEQSFQWHGFVWIKSELPYLIFESQHQCDHPASASSPDKRWCQASAVAQAASTLLSALKIPSSDHAGPARHSPATSQPERGAQPGPAAANNGNISADILIQSGLNIIGWRKIGTQG